MKSLGIITVLLLTASCVEPDAVNCDDAGTVLGTITAGPTAGVVRNDLVVRGTAQHSTGLTVRRILVAGVRAAPDSFNFESWSVTLPAATLASLPGVDGRDEVEISVVAIDACEAEHMLDSFTIEVDRTPSVVVERLSLDIEVSSGEDYLPATGDVPAIVRITANPDAAGARVDLSASIGAFVGDMNSSVTLSGDGSSDASANVLYASDTPGTALITATAEQQLTSASVVVAGPPVLVPSTANLAAGQQIRVSAQTEGRIESCQATPGPDLSITSGGTNLMATPAATDTNGDGVVDIDIAAASPLAGATASTVSCRDPYGQFSSGDYAASP